MTSSFPILQILLSGDPIPAFAVSALAIAGSLVFLTFVSEDAACVLAGSLAAQGRIGLSTAVAACVFGIVLGDVGLYGLGRLAGPSILRSPPVSRFISETAISRGTEWLGRRGASVVFISRFTPGLRLPTYIAAGVLRTRFAAFLAYFVLAAAIWTPFAVGAGYFATAFDPAYVPLAALGTFLVIRSGPRLVHFEGRRKVYGGLLRIAKWEFWPMPFFYFPIVIYCLFLALRHRSLTLFTCVNPGIMGSGFIGESKNAIFRQIAESPGGRRSMLGHELIEGGVPLDQRLGKLREALRTRNLEFPVVLKPDVGERGKGVEIIRTEEDAARYLAEVREDVLFQEYYEGVEASVFYVRRPSEREGAIFSITRKRFPCVEGDGVSDLRTLILTDPRAVILSRSYFSQNADQLERVPAKGEQVRLIRIGTHSRGAIFEDGADLGTPDLERSIDELCRAIPGFYFGRFDLRARTFADFKNGGPFKIIELNGVSSESTNIYDPSFSLIQAYRVLFRQWRLAFEIGAENHAAGTPSLRVRELTRLIWPRSSGLSEVRSPGPGQT